MNPSDLRYQTGNYDFDFGDDLCKAREMRKVIERIPDIPTVTSYADIGCGQGGVFVSWTIRPWNLLWVNQELMPA